MLYRIPHALSRCPTVRWICGTLLEKYRLLQGSDENKLQKLLISYHTREQVFKAVTTGAGHPNLMGWNLLPGAQKEGVILKRALEGGRDDSEGKDWLQNWPLEFESQNPCKVKRRDQTSPSCP